MNERVRLVGDIGGTHARLALARGGDLITTTIATLPTTGYPSLIDAVQAYLARHADWVPAIEAMRIAIAGPVNRDAIAMTNADWHFSVRETGAQLRAAVLPRLESFEVINDFAAQALALPHLPAAQVLNVGGVAAAAGLLGVLGPGTGFGAACLANYHGEYLVLPSEGGHAGIAADTEQELAIFGWLLRHQQPITRETLLSGPGLARLHSALGAIHGVTQETLSAAAIVSAALTGDTLCRATLTQFCQLLGNAARDHALSCGTRGGLYIGGGIVLHFVDFFLASEFRQRFEASPLMADYLRAIPTYLINCPNSGLIGAAHAP